MSTHNVTLLNIDKSQVIVNHKELRLRLMVDKDFDLSAFDKITNKAFDKAEFLCAYVTVPVTTEEDGNVNLGFTKVKSSDLAKNLDGCINAFVFAVTLGIQAERHLVMLSKTAPSEHFITDAYYSALAEALCDKAEEIIKGEAICKPRFSPGYGDLPLSLQKDVLDVLEASKLLGVTLTKTLLMTPQKTITAIMGIKNT